MSVTSTVLMGASTFVTACGWAVTSLRLSQVRAQLHADELTGLANRRELRRRFRAVRDGQGSIGLLMLDLDGFKGVNDTYGHDEGDRVLQMIAGRLRDVALTGEVPVRLHGDEFAVLLAALPAGVAGQLAAARRLAAVRAALVIPVPVHREREWVEASIGAAVLPAERACLRSLLTQADAELYRDKELRTGRISRRPGKRRCGVDLRGKASDLWGKAQSGELDDQPVMAGATPGAAGAVNQSWLGRTSEFKACTPLPRPRGMDRSKERSKGRRG